MRVRTVNLILLLSALACASLRAQTPQELRAMFDSNQAFTLRDAVRNGHAPSFYRGAVADSENRPGPAKSQLDKSIQIDPHSKEAFEAHEMLSNGDWRAGHFHDALLEAEAAQAVKPDSADLNNTLPLLRALAKSPDMEVVERRDSRFQMKRDSDGSRGLLMRIDGKEVTYGFDTGAALSVMGTSDAKLLGLAVIHVEARLSEASGTAVPGFDIAFARDLVIAGLHLRNVPFFVLQDTGEPFHHVVLNETAFPMAPLWPRVGMKKIDARQ